MMINDIVENRVEDEINVIDHSMMLEELIDEIIEFFATNSNHFHRLYSKERFPVEIYRSICSENRIEKRRTMMTKEKCVDHRNEEIIESIRIDRIDAMDNEFVNDRIVFHWNEFQIEIWRNHFEKDFFELNKPFSNLFRFFVEDLNKRKIVRSISLRLDFHFDKIDLQQNYIRSSLNLVEVHFH